MKISHDNHVQPHRSNGRTSVHPDILKLGIVSLLTDLSSEMIFSVFAIFFTTIAGASTALLGLVEGCADLSASSLNFLSGWLSDRSGKRKIFAMAGYGFSTLAKGVLLVSSSILGLSIFRVIERLGKSFRGPPRDAWLSAVADKTNRGYSFGVHKALDKTGAILGPLVAYGLLTWLGDQASTYQILFGIALVPALLSIFVLGGIKDQPGTKHQRENLIDTWRLLSAQFKRYLISASIFALAYFSFGFLLLKAHTVGFTVKDIVLLYALFNISFVMAAPVVGQFGDQVGRVWIIVLGYLIYSLMSLGFAYAAMKWQVVVLFITYGVFYSIDEAQSKAFITDIEPERRASAIGMYNFATGLMYLPASMVAGALWLKNPSGAFIFAACLASIAASSFMVLRPDRRTDS